MVICSGDGVSVIVHSVAGFWLHQSVSIFQTVKNELLPKSKESIKKQVLLPIRDFQKMKVKLNIYLIAKLVHYPYLILQLFLFLF